MVDFVATPEQQQQYVQHMAMAVVTGNVAFNFFENEHLAKAAKVFGVTLPSRRTLATTVLDRLCEGEQLGTSAKLAAFDFIDAASDGWRKKYCEQGAGLSNFCALGVAGAIFFDALNCAALRKDGPAIAAQLEEQAQRMTAGQPERLAGWVLDNTKANWAAMALLQLAHPDWIMRGCLAHGLSLAMKDLTVFTRGVLSLRARTWDHTPFTNLCIYV